jgi:sensor c-di-GMP phosphodiesterase-like protein
MRGRGRGHAGILTLSLLGTTLGGVAGFWLGRAILLRSAKIGLSEYARELDNHADAVIRELGGILHPINSSPFPYCSEQELASLQTETFQSSDFKDIGRTRDGKLYCSAFLGRLNHPYDEGPPALVLANGMHVYTNVAVVLASAGGDHATVLEWRNVDAVLSPNAFDRGDRHNVGYMIAAVNRGTGKMASIAGTSLKVDSRWVLSQGLATLSGNVYRSRCSEGSAMCAVTEESLADIWGSSRPTQIGYTALGGLAGFGLGLALGLLHLKNAGMGAQLHRALRTDSPSLRVVYEPVVDCKTGRYLGAEALTRWSDPGGLAVPPDVFVRIAEENSFIGELTAFVVRRATRELGEMLRRHGELTLSINIAASDMKGDQLFALLAENVHQQGIHPSQIILELTERTTADLGLVSDAIQKLRKAGYQVHIDDFGTGFSSLSYLDRLAVNAIKIDRAFTRTIGTDAVTAPVLPQVLALAESLNIEVIVEGVETEAQRDYLQATGKRVKVQGWYYSKPMTAGELSLFAKKSAGRSVAVPEPELSMSL